MNQSEDITMQVKMNSKCFPDMEKLARGEHADESQILEIVDFINRRLDCADFRMICILRSLYDFEGLISEKTRNAMKQCVLGFKYWMDEPGEDSMCYWSENHQLIFAVCEYLAGQLYPEEVFTNNGMTGSAHRSIARRRIEKWLEARFAFGLIEWHSNTYYEEDIAPLSLLIDLCEEEELVERAKMLMDLLLLDMALHSFEGALCASSGRCYEEQKKNSARQDVLDILEKAFGFGRIEKFDYTRLSTDFILNRKYDLPLVLQCIADDCSKQIVRTSMGLDLCEAHRVLSAYDREAFGCYLWAMEAFTNVESVQTTMELYNRYHMKSNIFLKDLQIINIRLLRQLHLLPLLVRILNPVTQGVAIQRANTYTCKTKYYMLSTAQEYHPGEFGDQQHVWQATLPGDISVFTTHPGAAAFTDNARNFSPGYWVGNGINPHAAQQENVVLLFYNLRSRKGFMEKQRQQFTHAWFPFDKFDRVIYTERATRLYAQKNNSFLALLSLKPMERREENELVQYGNVTGWACMVGSTEEYGSFAAFCEQVEHAELALTGSRLSLQFMEKKLEIQYRKGFYVNGIRQDTSYPRLWAPGCEVERQPGEICIRRGKNSLFLNFEKGIRREDGEECG